MCDANFTASRAFYILDILSILCHSIYYILMLFFRARKVLTTSCGLNTCPRLEGQCIRSKYLQMQPHQSGR